MFRLTMAAAAALAIAGCGGAEGGNNTSTAQPIAAPAGTSWVETSAKSAAGGFVLGNPNAPVKLIEYGALSCPACARFSEDSSGPLRGYIEKGTVSYEFRPFMLSAPDVSAFLLARCGGPGPFFPIAEQMFVDQPRWMGATQQIVPADLARLQTLPPEQAAPDLAQRLGLIDFVQQRGIGVQQAQACLSDKAAITELETIQKGAVDEFQISGTPTFIINGKRVDNAATWAALEPSIRAAGG